MPDDIVDVIGAVVKPKLVGRRWVGHCPFHDDRSPSFSVSREPTRFYCFGCGAKGGVDDFREMYRSTIAPE